MISNKEFNPFAYAVGMEDATQDKLTDVAYHLQEQEHERLQVEEAEAQSLEEARAEEFDRIMAEYDELESYAQRADNMQDSGIVDTGLVRMLESKYPEAFQRAGVSMESIHAMDSNHVINVSLEQMNKHLMAGLIGLFIAILGWLIGSSLGGGSSSGGGGGGGAAKALKAAKKLEKQVQEQTLAYAKLFDELRDSQSRSTIIITELLDELAKYNKGEHGSSNNHSGGSNSNTPSHHSGNSNSGSKNDTGNHKPPRNALMLEKCVKELVRGTDFQDAPIATFKEWFNFVDMFNGKGSRYHVFRIPAILEAIEGKPKHLEQAKEFFMFGTIANHPYLEFASDCAQVIPKLESVVRGAVQGKYDNPAVDSRPFTPEYQMPVYRAKPVVDLLNIIDLSPVLPTNAPQGARSEFGNCIAVDTRDAIKVYRLWQAPEGRLPKASNEEMIKNNFKPFDNILTILENVNHPNETVANLKEIQKTLRAMNEDLKHVHRGDMDKKAHLRIAEANFILRQMMQNFKFIASYEKRVRDALTKWVKESTSLVNSLKTFSDVVNYKG